MTVRFDLKEIAFPSSLPDPPHVKKRQKLTWTERYLVLKEVTKLYCASWVRDIGPKLRPNDYKKHDNSKDKHGKANKISKEKEPSTLEDLVVAARGGMETLRPALQRVYMTRVLRIEMHSRASLKGINKVFNKLWRIKKALNLNKKRRVLENQT